jgi:hypothetical protein
VTITLGGPALISFKRTLPDGAPSTETVAEASLLTSADLLKHLFPVGCFSLHHAHVVGGTPLLSNTSL